MGFPAGFPFYFDGKYHVSLAFPPIPDVPSEVSKGIGVTASYPLLIPNIDYLQNFVKGDIGIANNMMKEALTKNFNHPIASKDPKVFKAFSKVSGSEIGDVEKFKKDGKLKMPKSEVQVPKMDGIGFNGFEKTLLTSIFETQKPYMDIAKLVIGNVAKIEDIVARIMPLLSASPLTTQSQKPIANGGVSGGRPKAVGFQNGKELKDSLAKLNGIANKGKKVNINKDGVASRDLPTSSNSGATASVSGGPGANQTQDGEPIYEILSTVYSTGNFIPEIEYKYTYIDLPPYQEPNDIDVDLGLDDDGDPYKKFKPKNLIFGIFDSKGVPLDPTRKLKSVGVKQDGTPELETSPFGSAEWILSSPKWKFPSGVYSWPSYGVPIYKWKGNGVLTGQTRESKNKPDQAKNPAGDVIGDWTIKEYEEGQKNQLNNLDAIKGDPIIVGFENVEVTEYQRFMRELVDFRFHFADGLEPGEKSSYSSQIMSQLNVPSHLENVFLYGQSKSSVYKPLGDGSPSIPESLKKSLKPFEIFSPEAAADSKIKEYSNAKGKQPGFIWIDPESDYEMKIIRVDPTTNIEFEEAQSEPEIKSELKSFVKNKTIFKISDNSLFDIEITKNSQSPQLLTDVPFYLLENWNYYKSNLLDPNETPVIQNTNTFGIKIYSKLPTKFYENKNFEISSIGSSTSGKYAEIVKNGEEWSYREFQFNWNRASNTWTSNGVSVTDNTTSTGAPQSGTSSGTASSSSTAQTFNAYDYILQNLTSFNISNMFQTYLSNQQANFSYSYTNPNSGAVSTIVIKLSTLFETRRTFNAPTNPIIQLTDKSRVRVVNGKIDRWIYHEGTYDSTNLPAFGKERTFAVNKTSDPSTTLPTDTFGNVGGNIPLTTTDVSIPKFQIKVSSSDFPYGKMIDPSKVTNDILKTPELFSKGRYGHGDASSPQEIDIIKRYMLTDLDTESYYIIEGVLTDENTQSGPGGSNPNQNQGGGGNGDGYYKLPHAVGAIKVFVSMLVDVFAKLIPAITKLLKLFKNPASFVTEILKEKMGEGFSIFSKESFATFDAASKVAKAKDGLGSVTGGPGPVPNLNDAKGAVKDGVGSISDKAKQLRGIFKDSPLHNHVFVDAKGRFKFLLDGVAMLPFEIFGKKIPFGMEMNFGEIPESKPPIKLIFDKDLPTSKAKNMQQFLKGSLKDYKGPGANGLASPISVSDLKDSSKGPNLDNSYPGQGKINPNDPSQYEIIDIKYSTGSFINGVDYNYIYIDLDAENLLKEVDDIIASNPDLTNSSDAQKALEKLNDAIKKNPDNNALKDKKKDLLKKLAGLNDNSQPLLKMLLGLVTLPIKIIAGIIEWIMDFFKSLTNPMTLPAKIAEFLSFSWIMKFFTPKGILELAGVKFNPEKIGEWLSKATIPNPNLPDVPGKPDIPDVPSGPSDIPSELEYKDASPKGRFAIPDDFDLANFDEFLSMPFMPKLPTYTTRQFREMPQRPFGLFWPFICMLEKIINGVIDLVWSTLGIEAIIPAPHVKFCSKSNDPGQMDAAEVAKILSGDKPSGETPKFEVGRDGTLKAVEPPNSSGDSTEAFVYDITLSDGRVVTGLNYEELQKFISENEDVGYNFQY